MTRVHTGFSGVVQDGRLAAAARLGPARAARAAASRRSRRSGRRSRSKLRALGLGDGRRPALPPAAALRAGGRRGRDLAALGRRGGRDRRRRRGRARCGGRGRRLTIVTAQVADATGSISATWFNQPWLAEQARSRERTVRLRGRLGRHGFDVKSYDLGEARATADFAPVYAASEQVPSTRMRELVRAALAAHVDDVLDPLPAELDLPIRRDAVAAAPLPGRSRPRPSAPGGGSRSTSSSRSSSPCCARATTSAVGTPLGEPGELVAPLPRRAAVRADRAPGGGDRARSTATSRAPCRCSGCCRATSARARRWSRSTRCCARSRRGGRAR